MSFSIGSESLRGALSAAIKAVEASGGNDAGGGGTLVGTLLCMTGGGAIGARCTSDSL